MAVLIAAATLPAQAALNGTYTINPSIPASASNYHSFGNAVQDLLYGSRFDGGPVNGSGVSDNVTFDVAPGYYSETLHFYSIPGAAGNARVTFQSSTGNPADVTLETAAYGQGVVNFYNGASHITFQNMTVRNTAGSSGSEGMCFRIPGDNSTYNRGIRLYNMDLSTSWNVPNTYAVIYATGAVDTLEIKNNRISNTFGIFVMGKKDPFDFSKGLVVDSNIVSIGKSDAFSGLGEFGNQHAPKFRGNFVYKNGCCADRGLLIYNISGEMVVANNWIEQQGGFSVQIYGVNNNGETDAALIYNNNIQNNNEYCLYLSSSSNVKIYHNSLNATGPNNVALRIYGDNSYSGVDIRNNHLAAKNNFALDAQGWTWSNISNLDNNNYWNFNGGPIVNKGGVAYSRLADLKDAFFPGSDNASFNTDPKFYASNDLRTDIGCLNGPDLGISEDYYGTTRPAAPGIGFYQKAVFNDDIGVLEVVYPQFPLTSGTQDLGVRIRNFGTNTVTSGTVYYSLNGGTPVSVPLSASLNECDTITVVFPAVAFAAGRNEFRIWTETPNGNPDNNTSNDEIRYKICGPLNGTYTIDAAGGGDFSTFNEAVEILACGGVTGPVVFDVKAGTYTEQVDITAIPGASATNNVQFIGVDSTTTTLRFNGDYGNRFTVRFNRAKHVTLHRLNIVGMNYYATMIGLTPGADSNKVTNCIINGTNITAWANIGVLFSGDGNQSQNDAGGVANVFDNNIFHTVYHAFYSWAGSDQTDPDFNRFTRNTIDAWYSGGYFYLGDNMVYSDNKVTIGPNPNAYGFYQGYAPRLEAERNSIYMANGYAGFSVSRYTNSFGPMRIANNLVYINSSNPNSSAMMVGGYSMDIYNNTIVHDGSTGAALRFQAFSYPPIGYNFSNNIIEANNGAYAIGGEYYVNLGVNTWDYDNIYSGTGNFARLQDNTNGNITVWNNLADMIAANPTWHQHSISKKTQFASPTDLHLSTLQPSARGQQISGINVDFEGDARCALAPSLGADESQYADPNFAADFVGMDTVYVGAPINLLNKFSANDAATHEWDLDNDGSVDATSVNFETTFNTPGTATVKLTSTSCEGTGSVVKTFVVLPVSKAPVAEFVADRYSIVRGESIELTNFSRDGATNFKWVVTPAGSATFTPSDTSFNTSARFDVAGRYQICLIASNTFGADTLCKGTYVDVLEIMTACYDLETQAEKGTMYDKGGVADYTKNGTYIKDRCFTLIDPCASSLDFTFNMFSLHNSNSGGSQGMDSVRIYDGNTVNAPIIGEWSQNNPPSLGWYYNASSGKILVETVVMNNYWGGTAPGFELEWNSTPKVVDPIVLSTNIPDTAYFDSDFRISFNAGTRTDVVYDVDFDGDWSWIDIPNTTDTVLNGYYIDPAFMNPAPVKIVAKGCGGPVEFTKWVTIVYPTQAPRVDFVADKNVISPGEVVSFTDKTDVGPISWEWTITPATYMFEPGYDQYSRDLRVKFLAPGCYDVKLWAQNFNAAPDDTASLTKSCFVNVIDYCAPTVSSINNDIGISRVELGTLNNSSAIGTSKYTYYNSVNVPTLDRGHYYTVILERNTTLNLMNRKVWIDFDGNGTFDASERVLFEPAAATTIFAGSFKVPVTAKLGLTRMRVGTSFGVSANEPCGLNALGEFEDYNVNIGNAPDMLKPIITMFGSDTTIEVNSTYADAGATAEDAYDGNLDASLTVINNVDAANVGTYTVIYKVTDAAGNEADSVVRYVTVVDTQAPVITLKGINPDSVVVFGTWNDAGADVSDNYDTGLSATVSSLRTDTVGIFDVTYDVTDASGNVAATVVRKVKVYDNVAPIIDLNGADTIEVDVKTPYTEPGAEVSDNYYKNLSVSITGTINTAVLGDYTISYDVMDPSGNVAATQKRVVRVVDRVAPVLKLIGPSYLNVQWSAPYNDPGVIISDNYYSVAALTPLLVQTNGVDITTVGGPYFVTYELTDPSGNIAASVMRTVYVTAYTGIDKDQAENSVNLFPNPTTGVVRVEMAKAADAQISVYNSLGQQVEVRTIREADTAYTFDLSGFAAGAYLVRVQQGDVVISKTVNLVR